VSFPASSGQPFRQEDVCRVTGSLAINSQEQITAPWLEHVLESAGLGQHKVKSVVVTRVGTGQASSCVRIAPEYAEPDSSLPRSLIAKLPAVDEGSRKGGAENLTYLCEVEFYRHVRPQITMRAPRCFLAEIDGNGPDFVLVLEDLAPAVQGDQITGCSPDLARIALAELVGLHAPTWGNKAILEQKWIKAPNPEMGGFVASIYRMGLPKFMERCAKGLRADEIDLLQRAAGPDIFPSEYPRLKPRCLVHNDYRLDNFLFDPTGKSSSFHVVDWQTYGVNNPMRDVSYFLGGCLLPEDRRAHEQGLVREYHDRLCAAGVSDYSWDECWSDYRQAAYHGLMNAMAAMTFVTPTERGDRLFAVMAQRHARQILDNGAEEFLV